MKKQLQYLVLALCISVSSSIFAQAPSSQVSQLDSTGKKTGLWIEDYKPIRVFAYYKNGLREGICQVIQQSTGDLYSIGEFKEGIKTGTWYHFNNNFLLSKVYNIESNSQYKRVDGGTIIFPTHTATVIKYHPNGVIRSEGRILFNEDYEAESDDYGIWKYYDEQGVLINTIEFK